MKKLIEKIVWLLVAIGALNWGLAALRLSVFRFFPYALMPVIFPIQIIIGIAGAYSLLMYFMPGLFCSTCKKK